jgi:hypothetical protein
MSTADGAGASHDADRVHEVWLNDQDERGHDQEHERSGQGYQEPGIHPRYDCVIHVHVSSMTA